MPSPQRAVWQLLARVRVDLVGVVAAFFTCASDAIATARHGAAVEAGVRVDLVAVITGFIPLGAFGEPCAQNTVAAASDGAAVGAGVAATRLASSQVSTPAWMMPSPQEAARQLFRQPSVWTWLPSSQSSAPWTRPSPQRIAWQLLSHPSPSIWLPSSHSSTPTFRMASPQTLVRHVLVQPSWLTRLPSSQLLRPRRQAVAQRAGRSRRCRRPC